jgi:hypothetical protein
VLPRPSAEDAAVFKMLERLRVLDVTLPSSDLSAVEDLAAAIQSLRGLRALTICKGAGTYLNQLPKNQICKLDRSRLSRRGAFRNIYTKL